MFELKLPDLTHPGGPVVMQKLQEFLVADFKDSKESKEKKLSPEFEAQRMATLLLISALNGHHTYFNQYAAKLSDAIVMIKNDKSTNSAKFLALGFKLLAAHHMQQTEIETATKYEMEVIAAKPMNADMERIWGYCHLGIVYPKKYLQTACDHLNLRPDTHVSKKIFAYTYLIMVCAKTNNHQAYNYYMGEITKLIDGKALTHLPEYLTADVYKATTLAHICFSALVMGEKGLELYHALKEVTGKEIAAAKDTNLLDWMLATTYVGLANKRYDQLVPPTERATPRHDVTPRAAGDDKSEENSESRELGQSAGPR